MASISSPQLKKRTFSVSSKEEKTFRADFATSSPCIEPLATNGHYPDISEMKFAGCFPLMPCVLLVPKDSALTEGYSWGQPLSPDKCDEYIIPTGGTIKPFSEAPKIGQFALREGLDAKEYPSLEEQEYLPNPDKPSSSHSDLMKPAPSIWQEIGREYNPNRPVFEINNPANVYAYFNKRKQDLEEAEQKAKEQPAIEAQLRIKELEQQLQNARITSSRVGALHNQAITKDADLGKREKQIEVQEQDLQQKQQQFKIDMDALTNRLLDGMPNASVEVSEKQPSQPTQHNHEECEKRIRNSGNFIFTLRKDNEELEKEKQGLQGTLEAERQTHKDELERQTKEMKAELEKQAEALRLEYEKKLQDQKKSEQEIRTEVSREIVGKMVSRTKELDTKEAKLKTQETQIEEKRKGLKEQGIEFQETIAENTKAITQKNRSQRRQEKKIGQVRQAVGQQLVANSEVRKILQGLSGTDFEKATDLNWLQTRLSNAQSAFHQMSRSSQGLQTRNQELMALVSKLIEKSSDTMDMNLQEEACQTISDVVNQSKNNINDFMKAHELMNKDSLTQT